jgi:hypothetical protein
MSPRAIITGMNLDYNKHCQLEFGSYVQTHEEHNNNMYTRTTGSLAMRPTRNTQGGHYFFSLNTGRILNRNYWTVLPMPADVIDRVHTLSRRSPGALAGLIVDDRNEAILPTNEADDDDDDE